MILQTKIEEEEGILLNLQQPIKATTEIKENQQNLVEKLNEKISELEDNYNSLKTENNNLISDNNQLKKMI